MKNLLDIPVRGEMLLDTVHLWAAWDRYSWKKGTGDWWDWKIKKYQRFFNDRRTEWSVIIDEHNTLKIEGSVIHALSGIYNFDNITEAEFPQLEEYIRNLCKGRAVEVDLYDLRVCRVNLARNKKLDFLVSSFIKEVGKVKEYGTMQQSKNQKFHNFTYVRWANKEQRQVVLYDKIEEIIAKMKKHKI